MRCGGDKCERSFFVIADTLYATRVLSFAPEKMMFPSQDQAMSLSCVTLLVLATVRSSTSSAYFVSVLDHELPFFHKTGQQIIKKKVANKKDFFPKKSVALKLTDKYVLVRLFFIEFMSLSFFILFILLFLVFFVFLVFLAT